MESKLRTLLRSVAILGVIALHLGAWASESVPGANEEELNVIDDSPSGAQSYQPVDADVAGMPVLDAGELTDLAPTAPPPSDLQSQGQSRTEPEATPVEDTIAALEPGSPSSQIDIDPRKPRYTQIRPSGSMSMIGATRALGGGNLTSGQNGVPTRAFGFQGEFMPRVLQSIGVVSFGGALTVYPLFPNSTVTDSRISIWSVGLQARYQLRFLYEQILVPTAAFYFEHLRYSLRSGASGGVNIAGPALGGMLLLNALDPFDRGAGGTFYSNFGVKRTYLLAEARTLVGNDAQLAVAGTSLYFGIRLEY